MDSTQSSPESTNHILLSALIYSCLLGNPYIYPLCFQFYLAVHTKNEQECNAKGGEPNCEMSHKILRKCDWSCITQSQSFSQTISDSIFFRQDRYILLLLESKLLFTALIIFKNSETLTRRSISKVNWLLHSFRSVANWL